MRINPDYSAKTASRFPSNESLNCGYHLDGDCRVHDLGIKGRVLLLTLLPTSLLALVLGGYFTWMQRPSHAASCTSVAS